MLIGACVRVLGRTVCLARTKEIMYVVYTSTLWVCVFLVRAFFFHFLSVFVSICSYSLCTCLRIDKNAGFKLVVGKINFRAKKIGGSRKVNWWVRNFCPGGWETPVTGKHV